MTSEVIYLGELRTSAKHLQSGNFILTDAPVDNHGKGENFSPTDLVATALATCMITVMGIKANQKGLNMEGAKAEVTKIMAANPRRIAEIQVSLTMPASEFSEEDKKMLEHTAFTCPVAQSLSADLLQQVTIIWQ
ncbi:MAG: OsmC family protein [Saprospiraceae bacterium]|nr:OsmC family protein [Saprospiraceae bacterium]